MHVTVEVGNRGEHHVHGPSHDVRIELPVFKRDETATEVMKKAVHLAYRNALDDLETGVEQVGFKFRLGKPVFEKIAGCGPPSEPVADWLVHLVRQEGYPA